MKDFQKSATWDAEHRLLFCTSTGFITCTWLKDKRCWDSLPVHLLILTSCCNLLQATQSPLFHSTDFITRSPLPKKNASLDLFASPLTGTYILCTSTRSINSKPNPRPSANHNLAFQSRSKKLHFSIQGWQFLLSALLSLLLFFESSLLFIFLLHFASILPSLRFHIYSEDAGPPFTNCHSNIDSNKLRGEPHSGTQSRELLLESPRFPL